MKMRVRRCTSEISRTEVWQICDVRWCHSRWFFSSRGFFQKNIVFSGGWWAEKKHLNSELFGLRCIQILRNGTYDQPQLVGSEDLGMSQVQYVPWHFWKFLKGKAFKNAKKDIRKNGNLFRWQTKTKIGHSFNIMMCNATMERSRTLGGILDFFKQRSAVWSDEPRGLLTMIWSAFMSCLSCLLLMFCFAFEWDEWGQTDMKAGRDKR